MKMLRIAVVWLGVVLASACSGEKAAQQEGAVPGLPVKGTVTLLEVGALTCLPCQMMMPIIDALEKEYKDRAVVRFINVGEEPETGIAFGVSIIPTQILFDRGGKEVFRHVGFIEKELLVAELEKQLK